MKSNRHSEATPASTPKKRHRRTEEELIHALQAKISLLERRKQMRAVKQDPTLKLADKLVRALKKAETQFQSMGRLDLANSAKAAAISIGAAIQSA